ncbi:hypothetical protein [Lysobacter humi (ex Lee et al. 2017)]
MLIRALLVLLLVLNAGVAAWWAWHVPRPPGEVAMATGVPALDLVSPPRATVTAHAAPSRCYRYGPFSDPAAFEAARTAIAPSVAWTATAEQPVSPPRAWRVLLPQPDRATAQATAARIGAAGFADFLVLPDGRPDAHSIALGRYRSESAARERVRSLAAAGFPAVAEPVGGRRVLWLDVAADGRFEPASPVLGLTGQAVDCAGVPRDGRYTIDAPA